ncbi:universal stress protein [Peribacillus loiseleuriae]|uniref:Universal stress protein n=1 Tax=Peribacillus loiseleuriae TaxID=1679170 RepID=A0A0K9GX78_9BACI|nr:universal stress protein [Peribacillus loiseleuriae]KMY51248.1 universal stress protein UspA [Peribacillus loiseleuriae]
MTMTYKKILVAVDGSKEAEWALQKGIEIALRNDASLLLAHIVDARNFPATEAFNSTIGDNSEDYASELLSGYKEMAEKADVKEAATIIGYGSPKVVIPKDLAIKHHIDLIVCGATGLNAVERFLIGSVSENIVRNANCDVLIVRTDKEE